MKTIARTRTRAGLLALSSMFLVGAFAVAAHADWRHDDHHDRGHERHWDDHYHGGYDAPPPVVYGGPAYVPPPVVYSPGIGIAVPGVSVVIH